MLSGMRIELDGVAALAPHATSAYDGDDLGEGVCASFSLADQLNLGLRHVEIDITAEYLDLRPRSIDVCHTPAADPVVVAGIYAAAALHGVDMGGFEADRLSCKGTNVRI